ncbi:MAG TPA: FtsW/RodA/SpoVE family cell cycle protein, partial [Acidimicrobiia bacterium]|nr:FtsW/RodA/SpoVE family cell cycle protein [Acidimicrobiia bacterium]
MSLLARPTGGVAAAGPEAAARRSTELGLVTLAVILAAGGYVLTALAKGARLPADLAPFAAGAAGLALAAHVAVRRFAPRADGTLLGLAVLLNGVGFVVIARLDPDLARYQSLWTAVGVGAFVATLAAVRRVTDLQRYRYTFALIGIGSLLIPAVPGIGQEINGARLWVHLGPLNFQPGEAAKVTLVIFLAAYLVEKRELLSTPTWRVGPVMLPD